MEKYLIKTNCNECTAKSSCFIQKTEDTKAFYDLQKNQISYKKGEIIIKEGTRVRDILFVIDGLIKVYIEGPEKNIIIKLLKCNDFIGLTSLFGDDTYYFSVAALKETRLCSIDRDAIKNLITQSCEFSRVLSDWYCRNYNIMLTKCLNLGLRQLNGKLANILLYLNKEEFKELDVFSYISRKDLAELCGMSMESVVRILSEFKNEKIIEIEGKKIEIINRKRLIELSQKG